MKCIDSQGRGDRARILKQRQRKEKNLKKKTEIQDFPEAGSMQAPRKMKGQDLYEKTCCQAQDKTTHTHRNDCTLEEGAERSRGPGA